MKMQYKLITAITVAVMLPTLIIASVSISKSTSQSLENFVHSTRNEIRQIDNGFKLFFDQVKSNAVFLSQHPLVKQVPDSTTQYLGDETTMDFSTIHPAEAAIYEFYQQFGDTHDEILNVYVGTAKGGFIQYPAERLGGYDPRKRPWYKMGKDTINGAGITSAYQGVTGGPMVSVMHPIKADNERLIGVQSLDVSLTTLTDLLKSIKLGETGYLILIDESGTILADPRVPSNNFKTVDELSSPLFKALSKSLKTGKDGHFATEHMNTSVEVSTYKSKELGWYFAGIINTDEIMEPAYNMSAFILIIALIMVALFVILGVLLSRKLVAPIEDVSDGLKDIAQGEGDLTQRLNINSSDETGRLARWFNQFLSSISSMVLDIKNNSLNLAEKSEQIEKIVVQIKTTSHQQASVIDDSSQSVSFMAEAASDVAQNCSSTLVIVSDAEQSAESGSSIIGNMVNDVTKLSLTMEESSSAMQELESESNNITNILGVIRGIAEQTNLLALNAAIEAARAGEQGRGFAVVADEVRTLAQRSHDATEEIESMLSKLTDKTRFVSSKMTQSLEQSQLATSQSKEADEAFHAISKAVAEIRQRLDAIADSASKQHDNSQKVDNNIAGIRDSVTQVADASDILATQADELLALAAILNDHVGKFKVREV
ncbi:methyl-accepting chemotaxis protein [Alteromonas sp. a30]|uniref:methyl-accepting chemotaxis protein n=1 Tax=Alteromonas sp. a30 TaxID=2730917 RepID=UPI00228255AA|nr:methyl-accepting chemotaxis protein [Alteromonas sp. a30]MCY7296165.1 methyl-accepting chemotaxis protein [Alteromonas sp. a30]